MPVAQMTAENRGQERLRRAGVVLSLGVWVCFPDCYDLSAHRCGSGRLISVPTILGYQFSSMGHPRMTYLIFIFKAFHEEEKYSRKGNVAISFLWKGGPG